MLIDLGRPQMSLAVKVCLILNVSSLKAAQVQSLWTIAASPAM